MMKDIFNEGLEALEIPREIIGESLTPTATHLYQVMLLNHHRGNGRLHKTKVKTYADWLCCDRSSIYNALTELNEKGYIQTETDGWVKGFILKRCENTQPTDEQTELDFMETDIGLSRALVHRQALKIMIQHKLPPLAIQVYWELATQIDLQTGKLHERYVGQLATQFGVSKEGIYKAIRQLRTAGLATLDIDFGLTGHMPHVALAFHAIRLAQQAKEDEARGLRGSKGLADMYKRALYKCFGIPVDTLNPTQISQAISTLKPLLSQHIKGETVYPKLL